MIQGTLGLTFYRVQSEEEYDRLADDMQMLWCNVEYHIHADRSYIYSTGGLRALKLRHTKAYWDGNEMVVEEGQRRLKLFVLICAVDDDDAAMYSVCGTTRIPENYFFLGCLTLYRLRSRAEQRLLDPNVLVMISSQSSSASLVHDLNMGGNSSKCHVDSLRSLGIPVSAISLLAEDDVWKKKTHYMHAIVFVYHDLITQEEDYIIK
jgi:hypothetical protein